MNQCVLVFASLVTISAAAVASDYDTGMKELERADYSTAFSALHKAAAAGNATAERSIGFMYYKGQGVPQDVAIAELWFIKAAEHGDLQSQVNLGMMYENGLSVPKDASRSALWFLRAAEQGDRQSQMRIGEILYLGEGMPKDYVEADKWWKVAMSVADDSYTTWMRPM